MFRSRLLECVAPGPLRGYPDAARIQADGHSWVGARGSAKRWLLHKHRTLHASFPRAEAVLLRLP